MTHVLTIPGNPPITANQSRAWTWPKVRKHIAAIRAQAAWIARQQHLPTLGPSEVAFTWYCDNRRHDVDSISVFGKACVDGLVDAGVWADDNPNYITAIHLYHAYDKHEPRVEVRITPATVQVPA